MGWLEKLEAEGVKKARKERRKHELRLPVKAVVVSTRNADPKTGDPGSCEIGHFAIVDGCVLLCNEDGRPTGKKERLIGEDAHKVAARLIKEAWLQRATDSDFNRPISYHYKGWR
jgi:hypothetical protein